MIIFNYNCSFALKIFDTYINVSPNTKNTLTNWDLFYKSVYLFDHSADSSDQGIVGKVLSRTLTIHIKFEILTPGTPLMGVKRKIPKITFPPKMGCRGTQPPDQIFLLKLVVMIFPTIPGSSKSIKPFKSYDFRRKHCVKMHTVFFILSGYSLKFSFLLK